MSKQENSPSQIFKENLGGQIKNLLNDWLKQLGQGHDQRTVRNYTLYLKRFLEQIAIERPEEIDLKKIKKFQRWLAEKKNPRGGTLSVSTQNYHLIALRSFLRYLKENGFIVPEAEKIELTEDKTKKITPFLRGQQLEKFLQAPLMIEQKKIIALRDKAILEILFSSGLKLSELTQLTPDQVNFKDNYLQLDDRQAPLTRQAEYYLKKYLVLRKNNNDSILFVRHDRAKREKDKAPLTSRSIERLVKKYARVCGLSRKINVQTFRHSLALYLLTQGKETDEVQQLLGHKHINTTQTYLKETKKNLEEIYQKFQQENKNNN